MAKKMPDAKRSRVDETLDRIRNHRWLSLFVVAGIIVIGLGAVTNAIESIRKFVIGSSEAVNPPAPVGGALPSGGAAAPESITALAQKLNSADPLARRAGVLALKDRPDEAVSLLVTSSVLGALDPTSKREDTAFTSVVRETLAAAGPSAVKPLIMEWRRSRAELESRFASYSDDDKSNVIRFLRNDLNSAAPISADAIARRAVDWGAVANSDAPILKELAKRETLELISAERNIPTIVAELLRAYQVDNVDLSSLTIRGNFRGAKLRGANLSECDLDGADFSQSDLGSANLRRARLNNTKLFQANLSRADLTDIGIADGADFSQAKLLGADFSHSRAIGAKFVKSSLLQADFSEAVLNRSDFTEADFGGARLSYALLRGSNLANPRGFSDAADMQFTNLRDSHGLSADQRNEAISRGAVWDDAVATALNDFSMATRLPRALTDRIHYDEKKNILIWTGGPMDQDAYNELRALPGSDGAFGNAIFRLYRLSAYLPIL